MSFKHIQAQQHIHGLLLQNCKARNQKIIFDLQFAHVNATSDTLSANTFCNTAPSEMQVINVVSFTQLQNM